MCVYACNYVLGVYIYIYIYYICDMYLLKHFQDLSGVDLVRFFVLIEGASVMKLLALLLFSGW